MPVLGAVFPDFTAETNLGPISFHEWLGKSWGILFSHPADFTPVCTTELAKVAELEPEFKKRGVKMIALSCDSVASHKAWLSDIEAYNKSSAEEKCQGCKVNFPIIADPDRDLAVKFGMLDPDERDLSGVPLPARAVFIIGPEKNLKLSIIYPATTGRNFDEILRVLDSLQLTAKKKVATPANWQPGGSCMVLPTLSTDDAQHMFPDFKTIDLPSGKPYLRFTSQPQLHDSVKASLNE